MVRGEPKYHRPLAFIRTSTLNLKYKFDLRGQDLRCDEKSILLPLSIAAGASVSVAMLVVVNVQPACAICSALEVFHRSLLTAAVEVRYFKWESTLLVSGGVIARIISEN